jgi:hypothetical protein
VDGLTASLDADGCGGERTFPRRGALDDMVLSFRLWLRYLTFSLINTYAKYLHFFILTGQVYPEG